MSSSDLVFYVQLRLKPEYVQEWKDAVMQVIDCMSMERTFVTCYMHEDTQEPDTFTLYERWSEPSIEAFVDNQMTKNYRKAYEERLPVMLQGPRTASVLRYVKEWHRQ